MRDDSSPFRGLFVALFISLVVVFLVFAISSGHAPELTREQIRECQRYWERDEYCGALVSPPAKILIVDWIANNTDWLAALITASATVFIAYFTFTLKESTNNLWEVTKTSADAAVGVEIPRLILMAIDMQQLIVDPRKALSTSGLQIKIANHGKTEAVVIEECFEWRVAETLPPTPVYEKLNILSVPLGSVIKADHEYVMHWPRAGLIIGGGPITEDQLTKVLRGESTLWVYGYIKFRDFLGKRRQFGFCAALLLLHAKFTDTNEIDRDTVLVVRFDAGGPASYSYQT